MIEIRKTEHFKRMRNRQEEENDDETKVSGVFSCICVERWSKKSHRQQKFDATQVQIQVRCVLVRNRFSSRCWCCWSFSQSHTHRLATNKPTKCQQRRRSNWVSAGRWRPLKWLFTRSPWLPAKTTSRNLMNRLLLSSGVSHYSFFGQLLFCRSRCSCRTNLSNKQFVYTSECNKASHLTPTHIACQEAVLTAR